jgi:hypothetical protein
VCPHSLLPIHFSNLSFFTCLLFLFFVSAFFLDLPFFIVSAYFFDLTSFCFECKRWDTNSGAPKPFPSSLLLCLLSFLIFIRRPLCLIAFWPHFGFTFFFDIFSFS